MRIRAGVILYLLLLVTPALAREKTDVIVMNNGDHLTCQIKGLESGVLKVSFDYILGTQSVQWSKVHHIESKEQFIVKTSDGSVYTGVIRTADNPESRPVEIQVVPKNGQEPVTLERADVVSATETSDRFLSRFNGEINSGIIYSKGNQSTQYSLSAGVEYPRERWSAGASYDSSLSSSTGTSPSTRNAIAFDAIRLLRWNNWFYAGLGSFVQSSEQGIDLQTNLGGGVGRFLKNTNNAKIAVIGGLAWQSTRYGASFSEPGTQDVVTALLSTQLEFFRFNKTNLNVTATVLPALSDPGRVYFNTRASYYVKLFSNLTWDVSFYGSWDNQPPRGLSGSDYGTSSGLGWTFGNR